MADVKQDTTVNQEQADMFARLDIDPADLIGEEDEVTAPEPPAEAAPDTKEETPAVPVEPVAEPTAETAKEEPKTAEVEPPKEEAPAEPAVAEKTALQKAQEEISSLRTVLRELKRDVAVANAKASPEFEEVVEEDELTGDKVTKKVAIEPEIVKLQREVGDLLSRNKGMHEEFLDMMRYTDAFKDVDSVCTPERVADIIDMASARLAKEHNILPAVAELSVQRSLYSMTSPYKYLYNLIKGYHPDFKKPAQEAKPPESKTLAAPAAPAKTPTPANAPSSVVAVPKDTKMATGWTAARIDALDEDELSKVPSDVYEKYMRNELP